MHTVTQLKAIFLAGNTPKTIFGPDRPLAARRVKAARDILKLTPEQELERIWRADKAAERYHRAYLRAQTHLRSDYYEYGGMWR